MNSYDFQELVSINQKNQFYLDKIERAKSAIESQDTYELKAIANDYISILTSILKNK